MVLQAVQRDLKNYIAKHSSRKIPVGYSAADVREILQDTWAYMQCSHEDDASSSDFFGLNSYSWCGPDATFQSSGYDSLATLFGESAIPVFVSCFPLFLKQIKFVVMVQNANCAQYSEYGCNEVKPRVFYEVETLYGDQMKALSGGLVYEYSQEEADYGLVLLNTNGSVTLRVDYDNLQEQFNKLDINSIQSTNPSSTSIKAPECSDDLITAENFSKNFTIPAVCPGCQDLIDNGIENPQNGKLVQVTETKVKQAIYGSGGQQIENMELNIIANDGSNTPGGQNTSPSGTSGTPSAAQPSETKKGAAGRATAGTWVWACALVVAMLC